MRGALSPSLTAFEGFWRSATACRRSGWRLSRMALIQSDLPRRAWQDCDDRHARHSILVNSTLFLAVAHNMRLKGVDVAMRALASLAEAGASVHLAVAGSAADAYWTALAARLGIQARVHFLGLVADIAPLFAAADAMVHPTRWDACSLATIEGLAAGLPVVTTTMNGAAELIAHGETGLVLPDPEDARALAAHMRLLLDPCIRQRLGAAAREIALHHESRDNFRAVEEVLIDVAGPHAQ